MNPPLKLVITTVHGKPTQAEMFTKRGKVPITIKGFGYNSVAGDLEEDLTVMFPRESVLIVLRMLGGEKDGDITLDSGL